MGSDAKRSLAAAEKLLKQEKVDEALVAFDRAIDETNGDLLTVNRVGDAIAASGHGERAVPYYSRIADQFTRQGFFPKAIAIRKKILRLTPDGVETLVGLGDLYLRQEHPGDARTYYLRAADQLLQGKDYDGAREVYERLVQAEPDDARHRVRLAETRAIAGDSAGAAGDLIELGQRLLQRDKPEDAEKAFIRALELDPSKPEIVKGRIDCLMATGREDEALTLLEGEAGKPDAPIDLVADLWVLYETRGETQKADEVLAGAPGIEFSDKVYKQVVEFHAGEGSMPAWWTRFEPVLDQWLADDRKDRALALLDGVPAWLEGGFTPALERRLAYAEQTGDEPTQCLLLDRLAQAHRANGDEGKAEQMAAKLAELRPEAEAEPSTEETTPESAQAVAGEAVAPEVPVEYEAPAVPLSRADEEFVSGRMTQAEILEKYGLMTQAVDQLYEVVERFPGHLDANQRLVTLLRGSSQGSTLASALVKLSLARRAAGRVDVARQSVAEAEKLGGVDDNMRRVLTALDLMPGAGDGQAVTVAEPPAATVAEPPKAAPASEPPAETARRDESVIDFDDFDEDETTDDTIAAAEPVAEEPTEEVPAEPLAAAPEQPAEPVAAAVSLPKRATDDAMRFEPLPALADDQDDDDLAAIAAALDDELFEDAAADLSPASESEESLDEVFAAFRERVEEQVGANDFRTHYDLGIGYKEMGLIDAAVGEFEISLKSEELFQQSCVMLALCCREQAQLDRAVDWYRQAVDAVEGAAADACGLRYDFAEILLEIGDIESALGQFRDVAEHAPGFRDVSRRVEELTPSSPEAATPTGSD